MAKTHKPAYHANTAGFPFSSDRALRRAYQIPTMRSAASRLWTASGGGSMLATLRMERIQSKIARNGVRSQSLTSDTGSSQSGSLRPPILPHLLPHPEIDLAKRGATRLEIALLPLV